MQHRWIKMPTHDAYGLDPEDRWDPIYDTTREHRGTRRVAGRTLQIYAIYLDLYAYPGGPRVDRAQTNTTKGAEAVALLRSRADRIDNERLDLAAYQRVADELSERFHGLKVTQLDMAGLSPTEVRRAVEHIEAGESLALDPAKVPEHRSLQLGLDRFVSSFLRAGEALPGWSLPTEPIHG